MLERASSCSSALSTPLPSRSAYRLASSPRTARAIGKPLVAVANVAQTIPSLALFGFLLPMPFIGGIGSRVAIVALILYALLPIVRNMPASARCRSRRGRSAATAMGMTPRQLLWHVELPLAMPSILAGIRVATVVGVGTATIAAAIGAGGLGEYIFRGLSMVDSTVILAGAIPAALLAVAADALLTWVERPRGPSRHRASRRRVLVTAAALLVARRRGCRRLHAVGPRRHRRGLEELHRADHSRRAAGAESGGEESVERRLNLGGTFICDRALRAGDIDVYVDTPAQRSPPSFRRPSEKSAAACWSERGSVTPRAG